MVKLATWIWTLFGRYAPARTGPQGAGPKQRISNLARCEPLQNIRNQLEVGVRASWNEFLKFAVVEELADAHA